MIDKIFKKGSAEDAMPTESVFICQFDGRIKREQLHLSESILHLQGIYDEFKQIGIEVAISDMVSFAESVRLRSNGVTLVPIPSLESFVTDKLLPGVKASLSPHLKESAVRGMIEIPDLSGVKNAIERFEMYCRQYRTNNVHQHFLFDSNQILLNNGKICKSETADSEIETKHTYFTKKKCGSDLVSKLGRLCDALNELKDLKPHDFDSLNLPGIKKLEGIYKPELHYIQQHENVSH